jgi:hypothetical protein
MKEDDVNLESGKEPAMSKPSPLWMLVPIVLIVVAMFLAR